eukprot:7658898-Pyramimonas_sp.AAC.1
MSRCRRCSALALLRPFDWPRLDMTLGGFREARASPWAVRSRTRPWANMWTGSWARSAPRKISRISW